MKTFLPYVECATCHAHLDHANPAWVARIINGQPVPLCVDCAVLAGFTREGGER